MLRSFLHWLGQWTNPENVSGHRQPPGGMAAMTALPPMGMAAGAPSGLLGLAERLLEVGLLEEFLIDWRLGGIPPGGSSGGGGAAGTMRPPGGSAW